MIKRSFSKAEVSKEDSPNPFLPTFNYERWEGMLNDAGCGTVETRDAAYLAMFKSWEGYKHNPLQVRELEDGTLNENSTISLRGQKLVKQANYKKSNRNISRKK